MIVHNEPLFQIFFGDTTHQFIPQNYKALTNTEKLIELQPFSDATSLLQCSQLVFLHQVHGVDGTAIMSQEHASSFAPFLHDGDFLLTDQLGIGLAVATADCMPVVLYDSLHQAIAIAHAGWRGALDEIVPKAIQAMQQTYDTQVKHLKVFLGPCAKVCCYEVGDEVLQKLEQFSFADEVVQTINEKTYFNSTAFMIKLLQQYGVNKQTINVCYNDCTMCNELFCSSRRSQRAPERQMTIVVLK
jgi:YfiH family protein